jgi:dipeptidyl-peptidase-3
VGFWHNNGNYKGFGDSKFVPGVDESKFKTFVTKCAAYKKDDVEMKELLDECVESMFSLNENNKLLGYGNKV